MISAAKIKWIKSLALKKFRRQEGLFLVEGDKIVSELLKSNWKTTHVFALESWLEQAKMKSDIFCQAISSKELAKISTLTTPNQVLAIVKLPEHDPEGIYFENRFTLYLDNIQDPGNLGTIIRTADWFGVENVICSPDCVDVFNPKVIQATMGSFLRIRVFYESGDSFFQKIKPHITIAGALLGGEDLFSTKLPTDGILVIGNESKGISEGIQKYISRKLVIPKKGKHKNLPESLNASIAAAIFLAELTKT